MTTPITIRVIGIGPGGPEHVTFAAADAIFESYFGWDRARFPAAGEHNLLRARGQFALFEAALTTRGERAALLLGGR